MDGLNFAVSFPFSESARNHLKELDVPIDNIPETVIKKAALLVSRASSSTPHSLDVLNPSKELLESELMAFPVAKMFVSLLRAPNLREKLSFFVFRNTFNSLQNSKNSKDLALALADDFKLNYIQSDKKNFFAEVPLLDYLKIYFIDAELKLVNMPVSKGVVLLNLNSFARFLAEKAYAKVFDSLPIPVEQIPKKFQLLARTLESQLVTYEKKKFDFKLSGKVDPELFPPCINALYNNQLEGKKLSYTERLTLASFLFQVGMSKEELMSVQSKSPDFDKRIAEYHIDRIIQKQLSAPTFKKIHDDYALRTKDCEGVEGKFKHPVQFYLSQFRAKNRLKNSAKPNFVKPEKGNAPVPIKPEKGVAPVQVKPEKREK